MYCRTCRYDLHETPVDEHGKGVCPECERGFDPNDLGTTLARQCFDWRGAAANMGRVSVVASGVIIVVAFVFSITAFGFYPFLGPLWVYLCGVVLAPMLLFLLVIALIPAVPLTRRQRVLAITLPLLFASIALTHWPLRLMFLFHKPWFTEIADRVQATGTINTPGNVGIVHYMNAKLNLEGNVGIQMTGWEGGGTYLVRHHPDASFVWYGTNWEVALGDNWYLVYED